MTGSPRRFRICLLPVAIALAASVAAFRPGHVRGADNPSVQPGTIKGRLVWVGEIPPPEVLAKKGDPYAKDPDAWQADTIRSRSLVIDPKTRGVASAFAYLIDPRGIYPRKVGNAEKPKSVVRVDFEHCEFLPHCVALWAGQTLAIGNRDHVEHCVNFTSEQFPKGPYGGFVVPRVAPGKVQMFEFKKPEPRPIRLTCDIHAWETSYVTVFDHPFFAMTGPDGSFEIHGIPSGPQRLVVWHERTGYVGESGSRRISLEIRPGAVSDLGELKIQSTSLRK